MAKILIIGSGDIGGQLAGSLASEGHDVSALRRTSVAPLATVNYIKADVTNQQQMDALNLDYDQVVYILSPSGRDIAAYKAVFDVGVKNVLSVFKQKCQNAAFTFVSSSRVYGQQHGEWLDEKSATEPTDERGSIILAAEKRFLDFNNQTTIVRFSGIYGRSNYFLNALKKGEKVQQQPPYYTNRIHREDCVGVLEFLLNKKVNGGKLERIYLATDTEPTSKWDVANYLLNKLGLKACKPLVLESNADQNKRLLNSRLKEAGYKFKFVNYKEGYQESMNE